MASPFLANLRNPTAKSITPGAATRFRTPKADDVGGNRGRFGGVPFPYSATPNIGRRRDIMPTETLVALMVFIGMLAISTVGYWSAARQSDMIHRLKQQRPLTTYQPGTF
jgi:hypothetical protein